MLLKVGDKVISFLDEAHNVKRILTVKEIIPSLGGSMIVVSLGKDREQILPYDAIRPAEPAELVLYTK